MKVLTDSDVKRDRTVRAVVAIGMPIVVIGVCAILAASLFSSVLSFSGSSSLFAILGAAAGALALGPMVPRFIVTNPADNAFVTQNPFSYSDSSNIPYGPGWHFSFPWEQRESRGNVPLFLMTIEVSEKVPSRSGEVRAKTSVQLIVRDPVAFYLATAGSAEAGLRDSVREWLSRRIASLTAGDAVSLVLPLSDELGLHLQSEIADTLLRTYGIAVVKLRIQSIDLSERMQSARDTEDQAKAIIRAMTSVLGYESSDAMFSDVRSGKLLAKEMRSVREDVLAMAGVMRPKVNRIDLSGIDAKDSTAASAIFAALNDA